LIPGSPDPLASSAGPDDAKAVAIPLSAAEKSVFAAKICPVRVKNLFVINPLSPI